MSTPKASFAGKARELLTRRKFGVLATLLLDSRDQPFGSMVNYAADTNGLPVFLLSALAVHTNNLRAHAKASLTVYSEQAETSLLESARLTIVGRVTLVPPDQLPATKATYLAIHPDAARYVDFGDFSFYRLDLEAAITLPASGRWTGFRLASMAWPCSCS